MRLKINPIFFTDIHPFRNKFLHSIAQLRREKQPAIFLARIVAIIEFYLYNNTIQTALLVVGGLLMICKKCGMILEDDLKFCSNCGATLEKPQVAVAHQPEVVLQPEVIRQTVVDYQRASEALPDKYRPLGAWAYFGYQLLFAIPVVGFILLIVFSCSDDNINRRNFARSYWCSLLVSVIINVFLLVLVFGLGFSIDGLANLV